MSISIMAVNAVVHFSWFEIIFLVLDFGYSVFFTCFLLIS